MLINRNLLMREVIEKFNGETYSSAKIKLCYDCMYIADQWSRDPKGYAKVNEKPKFLLKRDLNRYVRDRIDIKKYRQRILGLFPSIAWSMSTRPVISWIINKIIADYA